MQAMLQFVRNYLQSFPGRLRSAIVSDSRIWGTRQECNEETMLFQILHPLYQPRVLENHSKRHFVSHPQTTSLQHMELIDVDSTHEWWKTLIGQDPDFIQKY
jgi:hypothetical protein